MPISLFPKVTLATLRPRIGYRNPLYSRIPSATNNARLRAKLCSPNLTSRQGRNETTIATCSELQSTNPPFNRLAHQSTLRLSRRKQRLNFSWLRVRPRMPVRLLHVLCYFICEHKRWCGKIISGNIIITLAQRPRLSSRDD